MRRAFLLSGAAALLTCLLLAGCGTMGLSHKDAAAQPGIATAAPPGGSGSALDFRKLHLSVARSSYRPGQGLPPVQSPMAAAALAPLHRGSPSAGTLPALPGSSAGRSASAAGFA